MEPSKIVWTGSPVHKGYRKKDIYDYPYMGMIIGLSMIFGLDYGEAFGEVVQVIGAIIGLIVGVVIEELIWSLFAKKKGIDDLYTITEDYVEICSKKGKQKRVYLNKVSKIEIKKVSSTRGNVLIYEGFLFMGVPYKTSTATHILVLRNLEDYIEVENIINKLMSSKNIKVRSIF